ncbi:MAG: helix-turn-helix domain-containing protein [Thermoplasmata archaeon]
MHLLDYVREREEVEFSHEISQAGIAEILGTRRSHVSLALSSLKEKGFMTDRLGRVENEIRRRKVYFLTHKGFGRAKQLKENFLRREIEVPKDGTTTKIRIADLDDFLEESYFLIDVLSCISSDGVLDLNSLTGEPSGVGGEMALVGAEVRPKQKKAAEAELRFVEPHIPPGYAVSFVEVGCPGCGMSFLIQASGRLTEVYTRCPNCRYTFRPFLPPPAPAPAPSLPKKRMRRELFSVGICMIALTLIFPLILDPLPSMIVWVIVIPLAVLTVTFAFEGVGKLTKSEGRYLILGTGFLLFLMVVFIQVRLLGSPSWETFIVLFLIFLPFLVLLGISKRISEEMMNEIAVTEGMSFLVLGLFAAGMPGGMAWASQLYLYFVLFGALSILLVYSTGRLKKHFTPEAMCVGFGIPIFISAMSWLILLSSSLDIVSLVAGALWLLLGLLLINVRFLPKNLSKRMVETLKSTTPFSLGAFFIIFGIFLLFALRYVESVVPFVVGIPVAIYGIDKPARSPRKDRIALFVYATILTLATLYPVFFV